MNIINILRRERDALNELLNVLEEEREALVKNSIEDIKSLSDEKVRMKSEIDGIEKERLLICGNMALSEVIHSLHIGEREEVEKIGAEIKELLSSIENSNETNRSLLTQSLNYTRMMINSISPKKVTVYSQKGKVETGTSNSKVLNKSI